MKNIIIILFLPFGLFAQNKIDCPDGYSYMPTLSTSSLRIIADECLPDSICKKLWLAFRKNLCGETSLLSGGGNYYYSSLNTWVNDSVGCVNEETFEKKIGKKWVKISRCLYYYENKKNTTCYNHDGKEMKEIACCGHIHKEKPL